MENEILIKIATNLATASHRGQVRKYTGEPYIHHPLRVAASVDAVFPGNPRAIIIAILHDVVEDTDTSIEDIEELFGAIIAEDVAALTKISHPGMNRAAVLAAYGEQLGKASVEVQVVKACDIVDNIESIAEHDPKFGVVYAFEKLEEIKVLTKLPPLVYDYVKAHIIVSIVDSQRNLVQNALGKKEGTL